MVRDHRLHPRHVPDRLLAPGQEQGRSEHDRAPGEDGEVHPLVVVHLEHEREHDHGHRGPHIEGHPELRLAQPHVVEAVDGRVHQGEHDRRRRGDHGSEAAVRHGVGEGVNRERSRFRGREMRFRIRTPAQRVPSVWSSSSSLAGTADPRPLPYSV